MPNFDAILLGKIYVIFTIFFVKTQFVCFIMAFALFWQNFWRCNVISALFPYARIFNAIIWSHLMWRLFLQIFFIKYICILYDNGWFFSWNHRNAKISSKWFIHKTIFVIFTKKYRQNKDFANKASIWQFFRENNEFYYRCCSIYRKLYNCGRAILVAAL